MCVYVGHYEALYFHVVHLCVCLYSHARHTWLGRDILGQSCRRLVVLVVVVSEWGWVDVVLCQDRQPAAEAP